MRQQVGFQGVVGRSEGLPARADALEEVLDGCREAHGVLGWADRQAICWLFWKTRRRWGTSMETVVFTPCSSGPNISMRAIHMPAWRLVASRPAAPSAKRSCAVHKSS